MTLRLVVFSVVLGVCAVACNPAVRCRDASDCGGRGVCSGGFCSEFPALSGADGGREEPVDQDGADSGFAEDAGVVDFDAGTNGRP
ncbi:MAG: hypothetical protein JNM17_18035 [Archangium sp.]|nr:hypothetical protein [Archangium sp.]